MTTEILLRTDENERLTVTLEGQSLAADIPLADLPTLPILQADPYTAGAALTEALGGADLLSRLRSDPDRLLLLEADAPAAAIPWEFAALDGRQLLGQRYGFLRLIDLPADPAPPPGALHFLALGADPLVDDEGRPRERRLRIDRELGAVRRALDESGIDLTARRLPPTADGLQAALLRGPAILHLSCHGSVIETERGPLALLALEDQNGALQYLHGTDLANLTSQGVLRLVVLSACKTASSLALPQSEETQGVDDATLARALVQNGVPAAIGMQGGFPDHLSDDFAVPLYRYLLAGHSLAAAVRQARVGLSGDPAAAGLPVCYAARDGWAALPCRAGAPTVAASLRLPGRVHLPPEIQAPQPLRGRNGALHELAKLYAPRPEVDGARVVTVVGAGGMGKTALAAAFVERFGYRWPGGVLAVSFAAGEPDAARLRADLLRGLLGQSAAQALAQAPAAEQTRRILERLRDWDGLLLLDNYESILQGLGEEETEALAIHRLAAQAARGGASLLLTSRRQPAKLAGERVFPRSDHPLPGLSLDPGAALFLHHSTRAPDEGQPALSLARQVADVTEGHPLAIALLAGEYDDSPVPPADFLAGWADELAQARDYGLAEHHRTFTVAFDRSYDRLPPAQQERLRALSRFPFPFFAEGAALVWGLDLEEDDLAAARRRLHALTQRSLLEVESYFEDQTPAAYRFQPALRQALARRVSDREQAAQEAGYAAYGAWLARRGYSDIHKDPGLARLVRVSMEALEAAAGRLEGTERLWHIRRLAWLKGAYGQTQEAYDLIESVLDPGRPLPDAEHDPEAARVESSLRYELANLCVTRGDLDRALALYQESLQLKEQIGDLKGKAASLHAMAQVYLTRGDLDRALALYQESLQIDEQIGDLKGKAASLHAMAQVYLTRGDLDRALALYQESLQIEEQIGDLKGKASSLHAMAQVYLTRGDLDRALALYQESLQIKEQIGDLQGKGASLHQMANILMQRGEWGKAEQILQESQQLAQKVGSIKHLAFATIKLGQLAQARGDAAAALSRYREGLAIHERLGMGRESAQVRQFIASLEGGDRPAAPADPLRQLTAQARDGAQSGDIHSAIAAQEQAVALLRQAIEQQSDEDRDALVALSVLLYNLAGYYGQADRHDEAVAALEQVVGLDQRTGHSDLESDRQALERARRLASLSPEERAQLAAQPPAADLNQQIQAQLAQLPPEQRAQAEAAASELARRLEQMSDEEQAQYLAAAQAAGQRQQIDDLAGQARDGALAALRGQTDRQALIAKIDQVAAQAAEDEQPGSPWYELAAYLRAVLALLRGERLPPVPEQYAAHIAAIQDA